MADGFFSMMLRMGWVDGELYVHHGDMILWLAHLSEGSHLTEGQRRLLSAIIRDMRECTPKPPEGV